MNSLKKMTFQTALTVDYPDEHYSMMQFIAAASMGALVVGLVFGKGSVLPPENSFKKKRSVDERTKPSLLENIVYQVNFRLKYEFPYLIKIF